MKRTYDHEKKPSQSTTSVKPTNLNLQTRSFAAPQTDLDEDAPIRSGVGASENLLEKLINTGSSGSSAVPIQTKPQNRLKVAQVQGMAIQAKLSIGEPNDKYEQEADDTAAKVVQQINSSPQDQSVQRQGGIEEEDELQMKPLVQRSEHIEGAEASADVEGSINRARGSGQQLPNQLRRKMENAMGADFSGVKIHTDGKADVLNRSLNARAFTTGSDIFFKKGEYNPDSTEGQTLIAHESTHVVQQGAAAPLQRKFNYNIPKLQNNHDHSVARKIAHSNKLKPQRVWEAQLEPTTNSLSNGNVQLKPRGLSGDILSPEVSPVRATLQTKHIGLQPKSLQEQPESLANQQVAKFNPNKSSIQAKSLISKQASDVIQKEGEEPGYFGKGGTNEKIANLGESNPVAKGVIGVGEGIVNAFLAPINPRFYAKWIEDYKTIAKPEDKEAKFGKGRLGTAMQVLDGIALTCKNAALIAGLISTITLIAGTALSGAMGAGAALLAISPIAGLVALGLNAAVLVIKGILIANNVRRLSQYADGSAEKALLKAKLWKDGGDAFGAALGVISGGLGAGNFMGEATKIGQGLAQTGVGQIFGTSGDIMGSITGSLSDQNQQESENTPPPPVTRPRSNAVTERPTPPPVTRPRSNAISGPSEAPNPAEIKQAASMVASFAGESKTASDTEVVDQKDALGAMNETKSKVQSDLLGEFEKASMNTETAKQKSDEAGTEIDTSTSKVKSKDLNESKLETADKEVSKAENELGVPTEEAPKKPGIFTRIKEWLKAKVFNIARRIKRMVANVKSKFVNLVLKLTGAKVPAETMKDELITTKAQVPGSVKAEQDVSLQAIATSKIAAEVEAKV